ETYRQARTGVVPCTPRGLVRRRAGWPARAAKRLVDVLGASAALLVLSPVLAAVAGLVRIRLGRPVLFVQERPGRHGRRFRIYKFRTMADRRDGSGRPLPDEQRLSCL